MAHSLSTSLHDNFVVRVLINVSPVTSTWQGLLEDSRDQDAIATEQQGLPDATMLFTYSLSQIHHTTSSQLFTTVTQHRIIQCRLDILAKYLVV